MQKVVRTFLCVSLREPGRRCQIAGLEIWLRSPVCMIRSGTAGKDVVSSTKDE